MVLGGVSLDMAFDDGQNDNFTDNRDYTNLPEVTPIQRSTSIANLMDKKSNHHHQQHTQAVSHVQQLPPPPVYDNTVYVEESNNNSSAINSKNLNKRILQNVNKPSHTQSQNIKKNRENRENREYRDDDDDDISFMDKIKMKKSDINKFLTLCAILVIALCYHDFTKLSINKIADAYNLNDINKYYLIFGTPTLLLCIVLYMFII